MAVARSPYRLILMEKTTCGRCGSVCRLLQQDTPGPAFFLCSGADCGHVAQVGVGPVKGARLPRRRQRAAVTP